jgi:feruloyl-CoA synthase
VVFAEDAATAKDALEKVDFGDAVIVTADPSKLSRPATAYAEILKTPVTDAVAKSIAGADPDAPASYMLTSARPVCPRRSY